MNTQDQESGEERSDEIEDCSEQPTSTHLRDLKPEKDPMGARNLGETDSPTTR